MVQQREGVADLGFFGQNYPLPDSKESACNAGDQVRSLGWEDPLEKEMGTHSSVLAWEIPWTEETGRQQSLGLQE